MEKIVVEKDFNGKKYQLETGRIAKQAHGSVLASCGETVVLATAVVSEQPREGADFFPLTVDFIEKYYAAGKIPGGFFKREAKPSTTATLTARLTDRPIRPLFPKGFRNDLNIVITVLSYDGINTPDHVGMVAASAALSVSKIPFLGPIGAVVVGLIDDQFVINPSPEQLETSKLELAIAGTKDAIMMVEAGAKEISEEKMLEALAYGHQQIAELIDLQEQLIAKVAPKKMEYTVIEPDTDIVQKVQNKIGVDMATALKTPGKLDKYAAIDALKEKLLTEMATELGEEVFAAKEKEITKLFSEIEKETARKLMLEESLRLDGRKFDEIRKLTSEVSILPRTHGSALFTRGETQALVVSTLGTVEDEQMIDGLNPTYKKRFYLHYNFPPYSVGDVGFMRGPGRRELGHGNLAERALKPIIPRFEDFPYTIRIVSEITESNGSSSMASVCGGCLSLMDAGIPIKAPVAGIAMGLVKEGDKHVVLTDIMGLEDHLGDMDFKVTGTAAGITALQMDIKIEGITKEIMKESLEKALVARKKILEHMQGVLAEPNKEMSKYAPRIESIKLPKDKIGEVIGPGGKTIRGIQEQYNVVINIDEEGTCKVASPDQAALTGAMDFIKNMLKGIEVGEIYENAKVVKLMGFGAFVEVAPGKQGLVHISEIAKERVEKVEDYLKEGQEVKVKCIKIDDQGRVNFTIKGV